MAAPSPASEPELSIIVPALNEAATIQATLDPLQAWRRRGTEVVVVDGGSLDDTPALAEPLADRVLAGPRGRARQMNTGAATARGEALLFLHADTRLPANGDGTLLSALAHGRRWGRFDVRLDGASRHTLLTLVGALMNARSRITGIATGDQALFMTRQAFDATGGFPDQPLMEDIAISATLKRMAGRPACLRAKALTASRRWEEGGILSTIALMWALRMGYFLGASSDRLARWYR
ncbi:TIGR04283 family arsenosugar biosynthesis glycosyltransferase [Thiohalorhabdus sp.]|uniref:TIGR04283 family arsenosugar biosynthesis glycosyltransferase n=1 Tax=Thiohalorhabdus sp. TaxID=3094134 RepID=UPI002FC2D3ED